jgi:hypothetical protein
MHSEKPNVVHHCSWKYRDGYYDYSNSLSRGDKTESCSSAALCPAWGFLRWLSVSSTRDSLHLDPLLIAYIVLVLSR